MGIFNWLRKRREFRDEKERRVRRRLRSEAPALIDCLTSAFTGLGGRTHQAGRIEAEVEEEMRKERFGKKM